MTASIPGENDTKRHRIALAALPFFLSACHLMPASKSGGVPSERAPVVWTVGHPAHHPRACVQSSTHERNARLLRVDQKLQQGCVGSFGRFAEFRKSDCSLCSQVESKPARREESID